MNKKTLTTTWKILGTLIGVANLVLRVLAQIHHP